MAVGKFEDINTKNIEAEIEKFESKVDFEFIPVIAKQSSYTEHIPWLLSLIFILFFMTIGEIILNHFLYDAWYDKTFLGVGAVIASILLSNFLSRFDAVKRVFISEAQRHRQVNEKAQMVFFNQRFDHIKSQNALMVYISIMEHRIEVIPDPQIKMTNLKEITDRLVAILGSSFKQKEYEQGFIDVIQYLQVELQDKFPRSSPSENVVSNKLTWWS